MFLLFSIVFGFVLGVYCGTNGHIITGVFVGFFIGLIIQIGIWDAKARMKNPESRRKLVQEMKKENKITSMYGIIDWDDK